MDRESIYHGNSKLVDLGKQINLEEELREFVRLEQALARDEIIRIREEKKEDGARIAAMEEAERISFLCQDWLKDVVRRGECCQPTALHRLCRQPNDKMSTCRRCWPFVNRIRKR